jgi:simple sugar transport system permease protein
VNPVFFTLENIFDLLKSSVVPGMFALGVLIVLISGGIDISFTSVAVFAMYVACKILLLVDFEGSIFRVFLLAGCIGLFLGLFNAVFVSLFKLSTLIVTLGTASVFRGCLLAFIGTAIINNPPKAYYDFSRLTILRHIGSGGQPTGLTCSFLIFVFFAIFVWVILRYTMIGRGIYAMGGNPVAAERAGFNLTALRFWIYGFVGFISGIAGIVHSTHMRNANPFDLAGMELFVIAAVVLGGASITGGRGTVFGTVVAVFMITIINNSLILLGIPSYWQKVIIGMIIIMSTGVTARTSRLNGREGHVA